jgi:8-oxo-dGTP diphosphatase
MPVKDQGLFHEGYQLTPRVLVFASRGDSVLLIKGSPKKRIWANLYNGVGGHVEKGEDILTAAKREFLEETGLSLLNPWLCAIVTVDTSEQCGIGMHVFRGEVSNMKFKSSLEGSLEWIPFDDILNIPLVEDLPILIPHIMKVNKCSPPLFLHYEYDESDSLIIRSGDKFLS